METTTSTAAADSIAVFTADRFVEGLYASLAWEATIQLGDAAISSRLVERVLRRAWDERDRFATADALLRHARDAARDAITREAERRLDVTKFDDDTQRMLPLPGDLHAMSAVEVHRRLVEHGSATGIGVVAPPTIAPAFAPAAPAASAASAPSASPAASFSPAASAARSSEVTGGPSLAMPSASAHASSSTVAHVDATRVARGRSTPATAPVVVTDAPRRIVATPEPAVGTGAARSSDVRRSSAVRERPHLRAASFITHEDRKGFRPRVVAGALALVAVCAVLAWKALGGDSAESVAIAALGAPSGASGATKDGEQLTLALPGGSIARLGAGASIKASATFGDGARALTIAGPVSVSVADREGAPVAFGTGAHRWVMHEGVVAFAPDGERLLAKVDSGVVTFVAGKNRTSIESGRTVAVSADGSIVPVEGAAQDEAFSWQRGRLQLRGASMLQLRERIQQWYGFEVRFASPRASSERVTLDVPLEPADSLLAALATLGGGEIERAGGVVTVGLTQAKPARRTAASPRPRGRESLSALPAMPRIQPLPTIPPD
jgi:ferric-dicitrate binding protein FerR (iron transport regulator)